MKFIPDGPSVLPLWLNGHAFLTLTEHFSTLVSPQNGAPLRRLPQCHTHEVELALRAAQETSPIWQTSSAGQRQAVLDQTLSLLKHYRDHFSKILVEETGCSTEQALAEITATLATAPPAPPSSPKEQSITVILHDATAPLAGPVGLIFSALAAGVCVIVKTTPQAPGSLFAFVELTGRAGLPPGVISVLHGEDAALEALASQPGLELFAFAGTQASRTKIAGKLREHNKTLLP